MSTVRGQLTLSTGKKSPTPLDDFKLYLDALNTASARTRFSLYLIMVGVIFTIAVCRDITPIGNWGVGRWKVLKAAITSYDRLSARDPKFKDTPFNSESREAAKLYSSFDRDRIGFYEQELSKAGVAHTRVDLPIIGVSFDVNDFGIISALTFLVLLTVFRANQANESKCFHIATARAGDDPSRHELLSLTQVLSQPSLGRFHVAFLAAVLIAPSILVTWRAVFDSLTVQLGRQMIGNCAWIFVVLQWFLAAAVIMNSYLTTDALFRKLRAVTANEDLLPRK